MQTQLADFQDHMNNVQGDFRNAPIAAAVR
jgi:hypothetical protein